ncbi:DUF5677 domain-containing protein [Halomonas dongshanensis]|uniref:Uncharacterized protein n=1 Tax=Halomonas dongshanensis TaxID=2890835 RepID=A0ABT2ECH9_9GAMM|nr:DUF5677 domain-containing protein [Halomonas dongshanensis]MCS2609286.1 hypothetical protein [Halomonas dongshanensis]
MATEADSPDKASAQSMLDELSIVIDQLTRATINDKGIFGCALRACVAKSFEFTSLAHQKPPPPHGFFITATLRGICEDLITFSFLNDLSEVDRVEALHLLMSTNIAEGINAQSAFFKAMRPWQPVVQPPKIEKDTEQRLRVLSAKLGWSGRQAWPTVWYMAKATNLHDLYSYLYSTTSKWVHFSPQILLRMGWGGTLEDVGDHTEWVFSTKNFTQYYVEFNRTYSLFLLLRLFRGPAASLLPDGAAKIIDALESFLNEPLRWPEAVTYEELNIDGPKSFMRILLRAAHESPKENGNDPEPAA